MIRVDLEGLSKTAFGADPIPLTEKQHLPEGHVCVCTFGVHGQRAQGGPLRFGERFAMRHRTIYRQPAQSKRQARVCGGV